MTEVSFVIQFTKLDTPPRTIKFQQGLHIIYGASGVGKSYFSHEFMFNRTAVAPKNFRLSRIAGFNSPMLVTQDPDAQIVAPTVERELTFNLENIGLKPHKILYRVKEIKEKFNFPFLMSRHPANLSGGEREILNLATALSVSPDLLLIDDGMSFLSRDMKKHCLKILKSWIQENDLVVIWMSSDEKDLQYSESQWLLSLSNLSEIREPIKKKYSIRSLPKGNLTLNVNQLTFSYPEGSTIFSNLTCQIGPTRSLGILGNNGSGKSTFGSLLSGLEVPVSGFVALDIDGRTPLTATAPQSPERLFGGYTPSELADMFIDNNLASKDYLNELEQSLIKFQIVWSRVKNILFHELSLSEARILLIAHLVFANYDVLILDEPMFSLGTEQRVEMINFLSHILDQKYLIFITHDEEDASALCDLTVRIDKGEIIPSYNKSFV